MSLGVKVPLCSYWSLTTWEDFLCHKVLGPNFWLKTGWNWLLISESSKSCQQHFLSSPSQTSSWHPWHNIMIVWKKRKEKKRTQSLLKFSFQTEFRFHRFASFLNQMALKVFVPSENWHFWNLLHIAPALGGFQGQGSVEKKLSIYFASVRQQSGVIALKGDGLKLLFYKY